MTAHADPAAKPHLAATLKQLLADQAEINNNDGIAVDDLNRLLLLFSAQHEKQRQFRDHVYAELVTQLFDNINASFHNISMETILCYNDCYLHSVTCLRLMCRDSELHPLVWPYAAKLAQQFNHLCNRYTMCADQQLVGHIFAELISIFHKLSLTETYRADFKELQIHQSLVLLLGIRELNVLHCALLALNHLCQTDCLRSAIAELNTTETLLQILQDYDRQSKILAARLLCSVSIEATTREMIKIYEGMPLLLSLLHSESRQMVWYLAWSLTQLATDDELSNQIRQLGGIPVLLSVLNKDLACLDDSGVVMDHSGGSNISSKLSFCRQCSFEPAKETERAESPDGCECQASDNSPTDKEVDLHNSLTFAICSTLAELSLNYANAQHIVQSNGLYIVGQILVQRAEQKVTVLLAALRTLRFLFSVERHRRHFKRLLPLSVYEKFVDVGHYTRQLDCYRPVCDAIAQLQADELDKMRLQVDALNQNRSALSVISEYAVMELLGSGAFGSVYRVKPLQSGRDTLQQQHYALKEINIVNPAFGRSQKERDRSVGETVSELTMIREQLRHQNIVRYYRTFMENQKLYILMELIEGAPLADHVSSMKEKKHRFEENRLWDIFIQMVMALRYLHKDKHIVHRDLSPNNVMIGENDKVTIADFGLAKRKQQDCSKLNSAVGTILYACPEIVQHQPYGEKADVWSVGCLLYEMAALAPPFYTNNMLHLATRIVEAIYEPIADAMYSPAVAAVVQGCLTPDPDKRLDIVGVAALIADKVLQHLERAREQYAAVERKLQKAKQGADRGPTSALSMRPTSLHDSINSRCASDLFSPCKDSERLEQSLSAIGSSGAVDLNVSDVDSSSKENSWTSSNFASAYGSDFAAATSLAPRPPRKTQPSGASEGRSASHSRRTTGVSDIECQSSVPNGRATSTAAPKESSSSEGSEGRAAAGGGQEEAAAARRPQLAARCAASAAPLLRSVSSSCGAPSPPRSRHNSTSVVRPPREPHLPSVHSADAAALHKAPSAPSIISKRLKTRPKSAQTGVCSATLTISPKKVRPVCSDPVLQIVTQLHKLVFITQLPPTLLADPRRRVIERFKRALFGSGSSACDLKSELNKLATCSTDVVDVNCGVSHNAALVSLKHAWPKASPCPFQAENLNLDFSGLTYEQLHSIVERLLKDNGYYA